MSLFSRLSNFIGMFTTAAAPVPVRVYSPPIFQPEPQIDLYYNPPRIRKIHHTLTLSEYNRLDREERKEIADFVRFRYQARMETLQSQKIHKYDLINDLTRSIEVPVKKRYKYLNRELISSIIR